MKPPFSYRLQKGVFRYSSGLVDSMCSFIIEDNIRIHCIRSINFVTVYFNGYYLFYFLCLY